MNNVPSSIKLLDVLKGHTSEINRIAWSPDGQYLASASFDGTVSIWDREKGNRQSYFSFNDVKTFYSVAWSPDSNILAASANDGSIWCWDRSQNRTEISWVVHSRDVYDVSWSARKVPLALASCSKDKSIHFMIMPTLHHHTLATLTGEIFCLAWSPQNPSLLASGSFGGIIRLWNVTQDTSSLHINPITSLREHRDSVYNLIWSSDGNMLASCSEDRTICLWTPDGHLIRRLEGHTDAVTSISFSHDGRLFASKSRDNTIRFWRTDTWDMVAVHQSVASNGLFAGIAFHPQEPILAHVADRDRTIHLLQLDIPSLLGESPSTPSLHYTNAKVVLVGESGVGKTALGNALMQWPYKETDSTHGRVVHRLSTETITLADGQQEQREVFLWDLAGQTGSRSIHQLYFAEVAVALVVFSDIQRFPLDSLAYWVRALSVAQKAAGRTHSLIKMLLVQARVDGGSVRISKHELEDILTRFHFEEYIDTSAKENYHIGELRAMIQNAIDWNSVPKVTQPELFQRIKDFLVAQKDAGVVLSTQGTLYHTFQQQEQLDDVHDDFDTCVNLIASQGIIRKLSFGGLILLQPELLDAYTTQLLHTARNDPDGLGSVLESSVRTGTFVPLQEQPLDKETERLLLLATVEDLIKYEIALREEVSDASYLVFPAEVTLTPSPLSELQGRAFLFTFDGPIRSIYATLAVRLSHSDIFKKEIMQHNTVTYRAKAGGLCSITLSNIRTMEDGRGELTLSFDEYASAETRFYFEDYVRIHLHRHALEGSIQERRIYRCQNCQEELTESQVKRRRDDNFDWTICPGCCEKIWLHDDSERFTHGLSPITQEIDRVANARIEAETAKATIEGKREMDDFDVYLCYNRDSNADKAAVSEISKQLKSLSILPWFDEEQLPPGRPMSREKERQMQSAKSAAVFIGADGVVPWQRNDIEVLLRQFHRRGCFVIPVLLAGAKRDVVSQVPNFLQEDVRWVDFNESDSDPLQQLRWGIKGQKPLP